MGKNTHSKMDKVYLKSQNGQIYSVDKGCVCYSSQQTSKIQQLNRAWQKSPHCHCWVLELLGIFHLLF